VENKRVCAVHRVYNYCYTTTTTTIKGTFQMKEFFRINGYLVENDKTRLYCEELGTYIDILGFFTFQNPLHMKA